MKISVITVCFNSSASIRDTIDSVLSQDHPDVEYIVIDGASNDGTMDIIRSFGNRISVVVSEKDQGIYDAINKGVNFAKGEIISILNSDDFYSNERVLSKVHARFMENNCECVYGNLIFVDRNNPKKVTRTWNAGKYIDGDFLNGWMPPHPSFFALKKLYTNFGIFRNDLKYAADYELMLRFIHKEKARICYLPEVLVHMRTGGFGNANFFAKIEANIEDRKAWKVNGLKPNLFTLFRKPFSKISQFFNS